MDVLIWRGLQIRAANCYEMTVGSTDYNPTFWEMVHSFDLRTNCSSLMIYRLIIEKFVNTEGS